MCRTFQLLSPKMAELILSSHRIFHTAKTVNNQADAEVSRALQDNVAVHQHGLYVQPLMHSKFAVRLTLRSEPFPLFSDDAVDLRTVSGMYVHGHDTNMLLHRLVKAVVRHMHGGACLPHVGVEISPVGMHHGDVFVDAGPYHFALGFSVSHSYHPEMLIGDRLRLRVNQARLKQTGTVLKAVQSGAMMLYALLHTSAGSALQTVCSRGVVMREGMVVPLAAGYDARTMQPDEMMLLEMFSRAEIRPFNLRDALDTPAVGRFFAQHQDVLGTCMESFKISQPMLDRPMKTLARAFIREFVECNARLNSGFEVAAATAMHTLGGKLEFVVTDLTTYLSGVEADYHGSCFQAVQEDEAIERSFQAHGRNFPFRQEQLRHTLASASVAHALMARDRANPALDTKLQGMTQRGAVQFLMTPWVHEYFLPIVQVA